MQLPQVSPLAAAVQRLRAKLQPVATEHVPIAQAAGRVLADELLADRDSPAIDVSAMDGFAIRLQDAQPAMPVQSTAAAGSAPQCLLPGHAMRIFTGAAVPAGADCIVRREDTVERASEVRFTMAMTMWQRGQNIRTRGENSRCGAILLQRGHLIDSASIAAVASFGTSTMSVQRQVRVSILNTGDELAAPGSAVEAWQIRDSNGPTLAAWLATLPWVMPRAPQRVGDSLHDVQAALADQVDHCDAIILSGGVSMGDTDYVPAAIESLGGEIVFHRLPIRPGKPVLGAVLRGKLVLGLPGNPVSVSVTSRVIGEPLLRHLAGCSQPTPCLSVRLASTDDKRCELTWFRLVDVDSEGALHLTATQGSGDLVSLSHSCGFVEIPPGEAAEGALRLTLW